MSAQAFFVTGTDTGVGKTVVSCLLLRHFAGQGLRAAGYKPVAAGAELVAGQWRNDDALALQAAGNIAADYAEINPFCLPLPSSPHLAAQAAGVSIAIADLLPPLQALRQRADLLLVEGAGGWRVPLNASEDLAGLAAAAALPVLLVVGVRLGCINHARLSAAAILADGLQLAGWVANVLEPDLREMAGVLDSLERALPAPLLATVAWAEADVAMPQWTVAGLNWTAAIKVG